MAGKHSGVQRSGSTSSLLCFWWVIYSRSRELLTVVIHHSNIDRLHSCAWHAEDALQSCIRRAARALPPLVHVLVHYYMNLSAVLFVALLMLRAFPACRWRTVRVEFDRFRFPTASIVV